jgi:hypothetical protein
MTRATRLLADASLMDTIVRRRSRRFALGRELSPPLEYKSRHDPVPLSREEEAAIVFAGAGINGFSLGELPYQPGSEPESSNGNIMVTGLGRTVASPDGCHTVMLLLLNDEGAYLIRRPQHYPKEEVPHLEDLARRGEYGELYDRARIRLADARPDCERAVPLYPPFNKWSANQPGSTYFVLVSELTTLALTLLFLLFDDEMGFFLYDERAGYRPAGLRRFAKSKGGHLYDDPKLLRVGTILDFESYVLELAGVEQGLMLQNMALVVEAAGLGGFPHYGAHRFGWFEALGFTMERRRLSQLMTRGRLGTGLMNVVGKNPAIPLPLGLERDGEVLIKPFCPPWYPSMEAAVHAFLEVKYSPQSGTFRDGSDASAWKDVPAVQAGIPDYPQHSIDAVVAFCEYVHGRYGRFLGNFGPLRTLMAYSAHHIDTEFYDRHYKPGAYHDAHRDHFARWHGGDI